MKTLRILAIISLLLVAVSAQADSLSNQPTDWYYGENVVCKRTNQIIKTSVDDKDTVYFERMNVRTLITDKIITLPRFVTNRLLKSELCLFVEKQD